jgi:RNA polymerase sigma factor FliA
MTTASATIDDLVAQGQGLVRSLALKISGKLPASVDLEDLIAYGQLGLVEAARDFDAARGNQFSTYAYYRIRGAIYDGVSKMSSFGRAGYEAVQYQRNANEALRASAEKADEPETADNEANACRFRDLSWSLLVVALAARSRPGEDESGESGVADPSARTPLSMVIRHETAQKLSDLVDHLPAEEATLIRAIYFEGLTLEEAGRKVGIGKSWASRVHARTLQRLARSLRSCGLLG